METRSMARVKLASQNIQKEKLPTTVSTMDTPHILNIFPEEIWTIILTHVDSSNDYYKICRAASLFQNLLNGQRIQVLFPDVLKALVYHNATKDWEWKSSRDDEEAHVDTELNFHEDQFQEFATLRLVCQSWKLGVDRALQNLPYECLFEDERDTPQIQNFGVLENHYLNKFGFQLDDIERFENHFEATHLNREVNPFITRKIFTAFPFGDEINFTGGNKEAIYDSLVKLLQNYGKHVWYLEVLSAIDKGLDHVSFYKNLKGAFALMPNLRGVNIKLHVGLPYIKPLMERGISGVTKAQLNRVVKENEKAPCPALKYLRFFNQVGMYMPLCLELVKPNLQNLEVLGVSVLTKEDLLALMNAQIDFTIKKLRLDFDILTAPWDQVFACVGTNFGRTLTELHIKLREAPEFRFKDQLRLPHLKILHVKFEKAEPLDFLLGVKESLEELVVKIKAMKELKRVQRDEREIELYRHYKQLHKSNVWSVFPKLKRVTTWNSHYAESTWSCTRDDWKAHNIRNT